MEGLAIEIGPTQAKAQSKTQPVNIILPTVDTTPTDTTTPSESEIKTIQVIRDKKVETRTMPVVKNPLTFLAGFYQSEYYKKGYEQFFEGKKLASDVTEEEKMEAFLNTDKGKLALLEYGDNAVHLEYDPYQYPMEARKAIGNYIASVEELIKAEAKEDQDTISGFAAVRDACHVVASRALVDCEIAPTEKVGRAISRLALIDKRLDTFQNAKMKDIDRVRSMRGSWDHDSGN
jgi:hypothetical protein